MKSAEEFINLFKEMIADIKDDLTVSLGNDCDDNIKMKIEQYMDHITAKIRAFDSESKILKHLEEKNVYEEPKQVTIRRGENDEAFEATLLPLELQIRNFLQLPNVLETILDHQENLLNNQREHAFRNIVDGTLWREIVEEYPNEKVVPIFLYEDDFNPDNALGPHIKTTNLSMFYLLFPTLLNYCQASIDNIIPIMIARAEDLRLSTNPTILKILEEFRSLEDGIFVRKNGIGEPIKIRLILHIVVGDNLALNEILGFVRNFVGDGFCRVCIMTKEETKINVMENEQLIRREENYIPGLHGIKDFCLLNFLRHYKVFKNFTADIMHDLFLGVFKRGLNEILIYILNLGFTISDINEAFKSFDWGPKNREYHPPPLTAKKIQDKTINLYAREVWAIIDYLPFFLRHFISADNEVFEYALTLVDILDCVLKSKMSSEEIDQLNENIIRHNTMFLRLFGDLTPKMHFMVHYKRLINLCGPLKLIWCFASERKHQFIKRYTNICQSRKKIGMSIGKKMCISNAQLCLNETNIFKKLTYLGKTVESRHIHLIVDRQNYKSVKSAENHGLRYNLNDFIYINENIIGCIIEIFVNTQDENIILIVEHFQSEYIPHLRSYRIKESMEIVRAEDIDSLIYPPVNRHFYYEHYYVRIQNM